MKYLDKKKTAEEMEQHFQTKSSVDYSLKVGEKLVLQLKNKGTRDPKSTFFEQGLNKLSKQEKTDKPKQTVGCLKPPPPPAAPISIHSSIQSFDSAEENETKEQKPLRSQTTSDPAVDDEFGDFQEAN